MGEKRAEVLQIDFDALPTAFPQRDVEAVLSELNRAGTRRRKLPACETVYLIIGLGLMVSTGAKRVLRRLIDQVRDRDSVVDAPVASEAAIHKARRRIGYEPLKLLFERTARPLARKRTRGAWFRGRRLVTLDGSTLQVQDSPANVRAFGRPGTATAPAAWPLIRFVMLVENGTRAAFGAAMGSWRTGETTLARKVIGRLDGGMLCLADRLFFSYVLWNQSLQTGADLLWRVAKNVKLPRLREYSDRSYLSRIHPPQRGPLRRNEPVFVRVVEFTATVGKKSEHYRVITNILDPRAASALELAQLYARRWTIETALSEIKASMRGSRILLRSRVPELVRQDFWGLMLAYFGVRSLMHEAALEEDIEPREISFVHALDVVIRRLPQAVPFSPSGEAALP
jgi:hypothetical protein